MRENIVNKANSFKGVNELALKGEIVIFGSTYMANFPFYELANKSNMENAIYNRSIEGLTVEEALSILQSCVIDIAPNKVFLHLGEEDYEKPDTFEKYRTIVETIKKELPDAKIYLISLEEINEAAKSFNKKLSRLCDGKKVFYIKFSCAENAKINYKNRFRELSCFFRNGPISFSDAFAISGL